METEVITAAQGAVGLAQNTDLTVVGLFLRADLMVKAVMLLLIIASFWCWATIFTKLLRVRQLKQAANKFERDFWSGGSIDALFESIGDRPRDPMSAVFAAAMREWRNAPPPEGKKGGHLAASVQQRIERVMAVTIGREMERVERGLQVLASIGSTAPFVGLFGTVWGIMSAFMNLGSTQNATLATVAPPIAEALIATAMGLFAAIPAVVAYNRYSTQIDELFGRYDRFTDEFLGLLQRQIGGQ